MFIKYYHFFFPGHHRKPIDLKNFLSRAKYKKAVIAKIFHQTFYPCIVVMLLLGLLFGPTAIIEYFYFIYFRSNLHKGTLN